MALTLVIHPGALGDVLLSLPALRALRSAFPADALALAAEPRIGGLLVALDAVDRGVPFDSLGLDALFVDGPAPCGQTVLRHAARVVSWFGAREATFVRRLSQAVPGAVIVSPTHSGDGPVWQRFVHSVAGPSIHESWLRPVQVPEPLVHEGRRWLEAAGWDGASRLVMAHPGAGGVAKCWPAEGFARVLEALSRRERLSLVVHEGPADADSVAALHSRYRAPTTRLARPPLPLLAGILSQVALYVGNDSGISHLAAAVGAPSLVLFTRGKLAWRPWATAARTVVVVTETLREADLAVVIRGSYALLTGCPSGN